MNIKRILLISIALLVVLASFSVVSAGLFDFDNKIDGIEFNITMFKNADGELPAMVIVDGAHVEKKNYKDDDGDSLEIRVYSNPNKNLSLNDIIINSDSKDLKVNNSTIRGYDCMEYVHKKDIEVVYAKDGKLVVLHGRSTSMVGDQISFDFGREHMTIYEVII